MLHFIQRVAVKGKGGRRGRPRGPRVNLYVPNFDEMIPMPPSMPVSSTARSAVPDFTRNNVRDGDSIPPRHWPRGTT